MRLWWRAFRARWLTWPPGERDLWIENEREQARRARSGDG